MYMHVLCQWNSEYKLQRLKIAESRNRAQHKKANKAETWYLIHLLSPHMGASIDKSISVALAAPQAPLRERNDSTCYIYIERISITCSVLRGDTETLSHLLTTSPARTMDRTLGLWGSCFIKTEYVSANVCKILQRIT